MTLTQLPVAFWAGRSENSAPVPAPIASDGTLDGNVQLGNIVNVVSFGIGPDGALYALSVGRGTLYRIDAA